MKTKYIFSKKTCSVTNTRAFTLVETLVVALIIGILTAIMIPKYTVSAQIARAAEIGPNIKALEHSVNMYIDEQGFPTSETIFLAEPPKPGVPSAENAKLIVGTDTMKASQYFVYTAKCDATTGCTVAAIKKKKGDNTKEIFKVEYNRPFGDAKWTRTCTYNDGAQGEKYSKSVCTYLKNSKLVTESKNSNS